MQITAYIFTRSPREYVNWNDKAITSFVLNKNDKPINFNPNDYIDATLIINDNQINETATDFDFRNIGGIRTNEKQGETAVTWFWRVINRIRNRRGQWLFSLQADIFANWNIDSLPIRTTKLNILNNETFRLIQQDFTKYPVVQREKEIVGAKDDVKGVAVVYANQPLPTTGKFPSGSNNDILNQFSLNISPPVLSGLPASGTRYRTGIKINELYADCGFSVCRNIKNTSDPHVAGVAYRVFSNGDISLLPQVATREYGIGTSYPTLDRIQSNSGATTATGRIEPAKVIINSASEISGRYGTFIILPSPYFTPAPNLSNIAPAINSLSQLSGTTDSIPTVITQNSGRLFIQGGKLFRMVTTTSTERISGVQNGSSEATWFWTMTDGYDSMNRTVSTPWSAYYDRVDTFLTVTYEEIGNADGLYNINWDTTSIIPPLSGSAVYAYAFNINNRDVAEALVSYFYRTYGSVIQDAQLFENLVDTDIETRNILATVTLNDVEQTSIFNFVIPNARKVVTSEVLTSYLALSRRERLLQTCFLIAPDGSSMLEVDKNFTSPLISMEYDLLPIEGKIYARFNYADDYTGNYISTDTQKIIMWRAGKYSGALSAFVEYALQNSTFQQIQNANFNMTENNNRLLDAQGNANLQYQMANQAINIEQQKANANMALAGGIAGIGIGVATGNPMAMLGGVGLGMNYMTKQMNVGFSEQQNAISNQQMAMNTGTASMLRANELALSKQVNNLNIQALRDRPNIIVPSNGVSIKRTLGVQVCLYAIPTHIANVLRDMIRRFGYDIDIVWTWNKSQNIMGQFMYLPYTPRINEFLQSMLSAGLYRENYLPFGDNIVVQ